MTIDRMALKALLEKGSDTDLLREMIAFVASRMMDAEVESLTGAAHGERSEDRTNQRNGYRTREWHTGVGTVPVAIPKATRIPSGHDGLEPPRCCRHLGVPHLMRSTRTVTGPGRSKSDISPAACPSMMIPGRGTRPSR